MSELKKYMRDVEDKTNGMSKKDRLDIFTNIAIGIVNLHGLTEKMLFLVNSPWASEQDKKLLLSMQERTATSYVNLASVYYDFLDTIKDEVDAMPEPPTNEKIPKGMFN